MTRAGAVALVVCLGSAHGIAYGDAKPAAAPVTVSAAPAKSEPPDSAVAEAAEANLESIEARRGFTFDAALGGGLMFGLGIDNSVGRGGSVSLRVGRVATRRTVITFEVYTTVALHKPTMSSPTVPNTSVNLLAGAIYYVNPSLWIRGAGGVGGYLGRDVKLVKDEFEDVALAGPAVLGGVGLDIARFKWAVLSVDLSSAVMINRDGVLIASGLHLGLSFD